MPQLAALTTRAESRLPPATILITAALFGLAVVCFVIWAAARPAWLGLELGLDETGRIVVMQAEGPSAEIPVGTPIVSISGGGDEMQLEPLDMTIEPDGTIDDYEVYAGFLSRAGRLDHIQSADRGDIHRCRWPNLHDSVRP